MENNTINTTVNTNTNFVPKPNTKKTTAIIILLALILIGLMYVYRDKIFLNKTQDDTALNSDVATSTIFMEEIVATTTEEIAPVVIAPVKSCKGLSEKECFANLSGCVAADSINDYLKKTSVSRGNPGWPEEFTQEVSPLLATKLPNAKFYWDTQPTEGDNDGSFVYVGMNGRYCSVKKNAKLIFSPIQTKEDALNYYLFMMMYDLGLDYPNGFVYIFNNDDYKSIISASPESLNSCGNYEQQIGDKVTKTSEVADGYSLKLIGFNYMKTRNFFEQTVKIGFDGSIKSSVQKILLNCGN